MRVHEGCISDEEKHPNKPREAMQAHGGHKAMAGAHAALMRVHGSHMKRVWALLFFLCSRKPHFRCTDAWDLAGNYKVFGIDQNGSQKASNWFLKYQVPLICPETELNIKHE